MIRNAVGPKVISFDSLGDASFATGVGADWAIVIPLDVLGNGALVEEAEVHHVTGLVVLHLYAIKF